MENEQIAEAARRMKTKEDLLGLLNLMKQDEMAQNGMSDSFYPFTMKHIAYYCNPNHVFHRYRQFYIKKKSGGERMITAPRNRSFKLLLHYVNELFSALYTPSDYAMGFAEGRSVVTNAEKHKGQNYVFNIDLKDFFPSIDQARVWKRLQLKPFNFPGEIANVLAGLCAMKTDEEDGTVRYVLPQGAPTSPIITNMICGTLDRRLAGLARRFGLTYTRYADDISFSSMHNVYQVDGEFRKELRRIIEGQHFTINDKKTRLQKRGSRQEVTGIVVSDKINVTKDYVRSIRNILYIWDRYGITAAQNKFIPRYMADKGHLKKVVPDIVSVLSGKLMYLKMVKGEDDTVFLSLNSKFQGLVESLRASDRTNSKGTTYVETLSLPDFEEKNGTEVVFAISKQTKRPYAYFTLGGEKKFASINKVVTPEERENKEQLAISYCRSAKDKPFWLIHRADKKIVPASHKDIDELNKELDFLLQEKDLSDLIELIED